MRFFLGVVGMLAGVTGVYAQERVPAFDFGLAINDYMGKTVTVEGCQFVQATLGSVLCRIVVNNDIVGSVWVDAEGMDRAVLKNVILNCSGLENAPKCKGEVTGTLELEYGSPRLMKASISLPQ